VTYYYTYGLNQASFDGTLYFPSLNLPLAIRRSHYRWSQLLDHRGRPKSKVRFGSFHVEVLATQLQLAKLTQLATDPHAIIDGYAAYHRADGQGTFVTVWFRQATLHHFTEHFDATGMRGSEPSWGVFFALSPQEMGREKGQAGTFVLPAPREHDKPIIKSEPKLQLPTSPHIPDSGEKYLSLTKQAYRIYAEQLAPAKQVLQEVFGEIGDVQGRAK
jgi:hypothetical protein